MERDICSNVPEAYRAHVQELVEQLDFQREKLEETRKCLKDAPLFYTTRNTQGDVVPKRNPVYDEYNSLMGTYNRTIAHLREILDEAGAAQLPAQGKLIEFKKYKRAQ